MIGWGRHDLAGHSASPSLVVATQQNTAEEALPFIAAATLLVLDVKDGMERRKLRRPVRRRDEERGRNATVIPGTCYVAELDMPDRSAMPD
jgi:hypothetical protein